MSLIAFGAVFLCLLLGVCVWLFVWLGGRTRGPAAADPVGAAELDKTTIKATLALVRDEIEALRLPRVKAVIQPHVTPNDVMSSRIGGPVCMPADEHWPMDLAGDAMVFLAQLNFAEIPEMTDFPEEGIAQIFVPVNYQFPGNCVVHVIWRPDWNGNGLMREQVVNWEDPAIRLPFDNRLVYERGARMAFASEVDMMAPTARDWRVDNMLMDIYREVPRKEMNAIFSALTKPNKLNGVGGHPAFVNEDPRQSKLVANYDCVLLQLGGNDAFAWGRQAGEANFLIQRKDLAARDFSGVILYGDA